MRTTKTFVIGLLAIAMLFASLPAYGQTVSLTGTTLSAAVASTDKSICLTATTGVNVPGVGTLGSGIYIASGGLEYMRIRSVTAASASCFNVTRSDNPIGHPTGATVYIGDPFNFKEYGQAGTCVTATMPVRPWIDTLHGNIYDCVSSLWQVVNGPAAYNVGLTALGPTAAGTVDVGSTTYSFRNVYLAGSSNTPGTNYFKITGASTSGMRTITLPDASDTVVGLVAVQTLTNKTLTSPVVTTPTITSAAITTDLHSTTAGISTLGTTALPFATLYLGGASGTPATNQFLMTGTSTSGVRTITLPDASITVSGAVAQTCASSATCAATNIGPTLKVVTGIGLLVTGSPSTFAVTGMSPAFSAAADYTCVAQDVTTVANNIGVLTAGYVSGSAVTFTGPNTNTDTFRYTCIGY
jgi:hypothetical protein